MKDRNLIKVIGSGGKGGGREPFEADDNMFARQHAAFIDVIGEGPIKGLVYGDASILVDETRIRDINQRTGQRSAAPNMKNFRIVEEKGLATQTPNADFFHSFPSASVIEEVGGAELLLNEPQFKTISSGSYEKQNTDYIKVTISTSGMVKIIKKGDTAGDRKQTHVNFDIDFRWTDNNGAQHTSKKFQTGFIGKVSGKYAHTFGFNIEDHKAGDGMVDWAIRVTRIGGETDSDYHTISNAIFIDSIESSIADKLEYPYTAYIAGAIDAEAFAAIPARGYEVDGKLINIPSNHFPIDYNGRKVTVNTVANFAVGDTVKQDAIAISGITAEFANKDTKVDDEGEPDADASDGYLATATCNNAHGITVGNVFTITIDGASSDADFWEGTFNAEATTTTQFTYYLNTPATSATDPTLKTLSGNPTYTASGTFTGETFDGGVIDKIDDGSTKYLYLRNVSPVANLTINATVTNTGSGSATVSAVEQVLIPANYRRNSSTEKVTTMEHDWDGTFYNTWCNNPAWVYNDLITNKIYGLGNYLSQTQVNKWELYQIARYCDELVPAGVAAADLLSLYTTNDQNYTGDADTTNEYEPRFSCNLVIGGQQEAFKVLNDVTSIFRGMTYWLNGEAYIVQDSEKDPVYQFTNGNVIDGMFKYTGTANKTRTNQIVVNWNNPQDYYRPRAEIVELEETLQKDGQFLKTESISAFGCTSRGQARRLGKWKLLSNNLHTNEISFTTGLNAAFLRPGDIVQVFDNHKHGKSWGGRIKSSSSTSSIKLDRSWNKETGYDFNDYQITLTFVGYKAILAQDAATIQTTSDTNGVAFVRGQEITTWRDADGIIDSSRGWEDGNNDITINSEEKAANVFDKDGNMVFVQWTPFTQTETKFIDSSDNADPSTLTISTAGLNSSIFTEAPAADSMWIISRAALSSGKTKEEAKLYRVLQIAETDEHQLEVNGLEYNATKFDAVDKNEALSKERQVNLPSTFKTTPPPTNLGYHTSLYKLSDSDQLGQRITFSWDPPRNIDDNGLYHFVREYEIFYSTDSLKWYHAGNTSNTSIDLDNQLTGTYYLKVFTKSVQDKRSVAGENKFFINFQRAVGPSEGTVGNGDFTINKLGAISGNYTLADTTGIVTFSPANQQHDDARNSHTVTGQPQLDFSGLSHTSTTGGNFGYIYMDHGTNKFLAIAHDEVSDQFYPSGSAVFANATGDIHCSTSMISTATNTPFYIEGDGDTAFTTELAADNVFKFTNDFLNGVPSSSGSAVSKTYYHRVKEFVGTTTTLKNRQMNVEPAVSVTLVDGDNQAFSKPSFLADYQNDTIIGMVEKTGSATYVLTKYGSTSGEGAYEIQGTNEAHSFGSNVSGEISPSDYTAYSNTYTVRRDGTDWTYAASGTAAATFGLTCTAVTGFSATSDISISSSGVITIADNSLDSATTATATIQIKDLQRNYVIANRVLSFSKAVTGSASAGTDAIAIKLIPDKHVITYDVDGNEEGTQSIAFTTVVQGDSELSGTAFYEFLVDGSAPSGGAVNSDTSTWTLPDANEPGVSTTKTIKVQLRDGGTGGTVKATDTVGLYGIKSGADSYTVVVTNEAHTLSTTNTAAANGSSGVTYTGSGTDIRVLKGSSLLEPTTGSVTTGKFKVTVNSDTNITVNPSPTLEDFGSTGTNNTVRFGVHSAMDAQFAEIEYSIAIEGIQTVTKHQTFAKSNQGQAGENAKVVVVSADAQIMVKGSEPDVGQTFVWYDPATITIKAHTTNTTTNGAWTTSAGTLSSVVDTHTAPSCVVTAANLVDGMTVTYTLHSNDGATSDSVTLELIDEADRGITAILSNETHTYQAASNGYVSSVTGSGTNITLYEGDKKLDYDGTGTADGHWKVNTISDETGLTEGSAIAGGSASTGRHAVIGNHTPSTGVDSYTITYNMTGKSSKGQAIDVTKIQTLTKAKAGDDGDDAYTLNASNDNHTFSGTAAGVVASNDFTNTFTVKRGTTTLTYNATATTSDTWRFSVGPTGTGGIATNKITNSSGVLTVANDSVLVATGTSTLVGGITGTIVDNNGSGADVVIGTFAITLNKNLAGEVGAGGINTKKMFQRKATWPGLTAGHPGSSVTVTLTVAEMQALNPAWATAIPASGASLLWEVTGIQSSVGSSDYDWGYPTLNITGSSIVDDLYGFELFDADNINLSWDGNDIRFDIDGITFTELSASAPSTFYNENVDLFAGSFASAPSAGSYTNKYYYNTTSKSFWQESGGSWVNIGNNPTDLGDLDSTADSKLSGIQDAATNNNVYNGNTTLRGNTTGTAGDFFYDESLGELYIWE